MCVCVCVRMYVFERGGVVGSKPKNAGTGQGDLGWGDGRVAGAEGGGAGVHGGGREWREGPRRGGAGARARCRMFAASTHTPYHDCSLHSSSC